MSDLRPIVFELLAAFSYLQSKDLIPPEIDLEPVIKQAREALFIQAEAQLEPMELLPELKVIKATEVIAHQPMMDDAGIPAFKICANCGDRTNKIVHLKRRPPMLECQACGYTYKWPHRWG